MEAKNDNNCLSLFSSIKKQKTKRKGKNQWCAENLNIHYKMEKTASK
jgi:hypothetical protein